MVATRIRRGAHLHLYIAEWQKEKGWTDQQFADRMGVQRNTIWRWKQPNEQHRLRPDKIANIAHVLGIEPVDLYRLPGERPSLDAMTADQPDDEFERILSIVRTLTKRQAS